MYIVYILHFEPSYKRIRHYTGYTIDLKRRLRKHRNGTGSRWVSFMLRTGSDFTVARTWTVATRREAREKELKIKRAGAGKYCPLCRRGKK